MKQKVLTTAVVILAVLVMSAIVAPLTSAAVMPSLKTGKVLHFAFNNLAQYQESASKVADLSGKGNIGTPISTKWNKTGGLYRDGAYEFDGYNDQIVVKDADSLSPATKKAFTVSMWVKFGRTSFVGDGSHKDYIHFVGKSSDGEHEFVFRQYNKSNDEGRNNRVSFYMFNSNGGLGAGSYVQEPIKIGEWVHIVGVFNGTHVQMWKNGVLKDADPISGYNIKPQNRNAPLEIGRVDDGTYWRGSVDDMRVYNRALTAAEIKSLYAIKPAEMLS